MFPYTGHTCSKLNETPLTYCFELITVGSKYKMAVVIDNGSGFMKVGISADEAPKYVFPTVVADVEVIIT